MICEQRLEATEGESSVGIWWKSVPGRENNSYKVPEVRAHLVYSETAGRPVWRGKSCEVYEISAGARGAGNDTKIFRTL